MNSKPAVIPRSVCHCVLLLLALTNVAAAEHARAPNVVLITIDTLRADRVGCYGYKQARTATLDNLARDGVAFRTVVVSSPLTFPSHCSILTGTSPPVHGVRDNVGYRFSGRPSTLARVLSSQHYATGAFVGAYLLDKRRGLGEGFETYSSPFRGTLENSLVNNLQSAQRRAEEVIADALAWLRTIQGRPFFVWVHLFDPHTPYDPPGRFRALLRDPYDGEIAYADYALGKLTDWLKAVNLYDETLIVATSDHGESFGEHGEHTHGYFVYDTTLLVPLIIKPPSSRHAAAHRVDVPVRSIDIAPTILQFAGVPLPPAMEGTSLLSLILGKPGRGPARAAYSETYYPNEFGWSGLRGLREERFKYIEAPKPELYDLESDPQELHNVNLNNKALAAGLHSQLENRIARWTQAGATRAAAISPAETDLLRSLGYIGSPSSVSPSAAPQNLPDPKDKLAVYKALSSAAQAVSEGGCTNAVVAGLDRLAQREPSLFLAHLLLGKCRLASGDYAVASRNFSAAARLRPENPEGLLYNAICDFQLGRLGEASAGFEHMLKTYPDEPQAHFYLGLIHQQADRRDEAIAEFRKSVAAQPEFEQGHYKLGFMLARMGRYPDAITEFKKVVALDFKNAEAHYNLGLAYSRNGESNEAHQELAAACRLNPDLCRKQAR